MSDLTSVFKSNTTTTMTMSNDNDDDDDNEKTARRATPSSSSSSSAHPDPSGEDSSGRGLHRAPQKCTVAIGSQTEDSWLSDASPRRVGGRVYGIVTKPDLFIPDHQRVRFPIVLTTSLFIRPTGTTDVSGRAQLPVVPTPESNIDPSQSTQSAETDQSTQLRPISKTAETEPCQFSDWTLGRSVATPEIAIQQTQGSPPQLPLIRS